MLKSLNHDALNALGLTVWQPRYFRHPECSPRCLVLLYCSGDTVDLLQPAAQKILTGMLSVLELPEQAIMQATIYGTTSNLQEISAIVKQWQPRYILQLNMDLPDVNFGLPCVRTFSPQYLLQNPQYKSQAYKSLLFLREKLYGTS